MGEENVADFAARLGLEVDDKQWAKGVNWMHVMGRRLHQMRTEAADASAKGVDVSKAMGLIGLGAPPAAAAGFNFAGMFAAVAKAATVAAAAVGVAAAGLASLVEGTLDQTGALADLSQKTGLSAEALQEWGYAAKLGGSSAEGFGAGVKKLALSLKHAGEEKDEAVEALGAVGISADRVNKILSGEASLDDALVDIANAFAGMEDGPKKTALAMALFGKSGVDLIPTLNLGRNGITQLREEAKALGVVMSNDAVSAGDNLGDTIDKIKSIAGGLKNQLAVALFPTIQKGADTIMLWVKGNQELIRTKVREFAEGIVVGIQKLVAAGEWLYENREVFLVPLQLFVDAVESAGKTIAFLRNAIVSIKDAVAPVLQWLADKFGAVANAIGRVVDGVDALTGGGKDNGQGGKSKGWFKRGAGAVWDTVKDPTTLVTGGAAVGIARRLFSSGQGQDQAQANNGQALSAVDWAAGLGTPTMPGSTSNSSSVTNAPVFDATTNIEIHAAPGMSPVEVADEVTRQFDEMWDAKLRQAKGG